jgi:hypothetical protein
MEVAGFDYAEGRAVSMTPAQWRKAYPPSAFRRAVNGAQGETWYRRDGSHKLVAEAYGIIPAGKPSQRES